MKRILSGMQPTGHLNLGNYLGALRNWVRMQGEGECLFSVVDLHALTQSPDPEILRAQTREMAATYIAAGVDPQKNILFLQSAVPQHAELSWILSTYAWMGWLNRMTQFKEKAGKKAEQANAGLFFYPVLMAADILLYRATHIPVGEDQKQHLELARDIAGAFNRSAGRDFFPLPEPQILGIGTRVMSLRDGAKKMSKSDESDYSRINLRDDADTIALKIRKAKTDPEPLPSEVKGLEGRPEAANLVTIFAALEDRTPDQVLIQFGGQTFSVFKEALTGVLVAHLTPISSELNRLMADPGEIDTILKQGSDRARQMAEKTLDEVKDIIGLLRV
ncbi:MAG: tryptophan--tRNA ligase [Pseudomonadota bacterium]|nr:tryptophan--tRNA ligase [Pseudomonadota bacterium]